MAKKYVDAELLKAEIKRQKHELELSIQSQGDYGQSCHIVAYDNILSLIDSLQQEQPEVNLVAELKHHLDTTPKEQLEKEWKELEPWNNIGPTVQEFLYGKQPEVDLRKFSEKMNAWKSRYNHPDNIPIKAAMAFTARMFYMYPDIARQWYESLPKATMD